MTFCVYLLQSIQALTNYKNKSTGQLSAVTLTLLMFGSLARVFTSVQETGDPVIILSYVISTICNIVLSFQLYLYWNSTIDKAKGDTAGKKPV